LIVNVLFFKRSGKELHAAGPAQEKAHLPYVDSRHLGTSKSLRVPERSWRRFSMLQVCRHSSDRYGSAMTCRHLYTIMQSLNVIRSRSSRRSRNKTLFWVVSACNQYSFDVGQVGDVDTSLQNICCRIYSVFPVIDGRISR